VDAVRVTRRCLDCEVAGLLSKEWEAEFLDHLRALDTELPLAGPDWGFDSLL
jgi:hypothetical protein